jgi:hypothetical protein
MTPMTLNLKQRRYVETVLAGLPHLAEAVAAIPPDWQPAALQAAERSYLKAFRQLGLSGPQTWASSVMRRLRRRVREAEKEKLTKLYEQLSADEHGSALPFGQAHSSVPHQAALSEDRKNVGGDLSADEQVGEEHSFATQEAASSEEQNAGGEVSADSADELVGEEHSFATREPAPSEEQNVELSADEQVGEKHSFATHEPPSSEGQNAGGELSAGERVGEEHGFATHEPASSEEQNVGGELEEQSFATQEVASSEEQKNVARESVKKDAVALRMARIMIRVDEIFDDGRHPMVDKQSSNRRTHSEDR